MSRSASLKQQLEAYKNGKFIDSDGNEDEVCCNFFDWFCKDTSLPRKAKSLYSKVKTFLKHNPDIDTTKVYVFFKNNCPMNGPLYDDFRICDMETQDVIWTVTPRCGHTGLAEIWGKINGFKAPYKTADNYSSLFK